MGKPKRMWDDIHTPEKVFWTEQFYCTVWLPLDECVSRLQNLRASRSWLSPAYQVNAVYDEHVLTADICKLSKSGTVWGVIQIKSMDDAAQFELKASVGPDIVISFIMIAVLGVFFLPVLFSNNPGAILFILLILGALVFAILYGMAWLKANLIDDVKKAFDIPLELSESDSL